jgi:hypothetical protein
MKDVNFLAAGHSGMSLTVGGLEVDVMDRK